MSHTISRYFHASEAALIGAVILLAAGGCDPVTRSQSAQTAAATLEATVVLPGSQFNRPHQGRTSDCGRLRHPTELIPLRYADGTPRGHHVSGQYPATKRQLNRRDGKA